ncbi:hypothetical protein Pint_04655 [Pistacia integerrima]|uniref:Uncharacterized protein n=1 Tax=Pistacia integerrima TaxID=434235 RepID=A0ACC0Z8Q0_9ROSI|nr:hypothetical protein Pint_04655 [Pistacia integerrima]
MSRLIQQAFANSSDFLQNQHSSKGMTRTYDIPRYRPPRNLDLESHNNTTGIKEMNRRYSLNQGKMRKSLSALESEEVQGFKDLGFTFDKKNLTPSVVDILPGLQEKKKEELDEEDNKMRKPYLSEAWLVQSCAPPPVPNWVSKNSAEDMKTQINPSFSSLPHSLSLSLAILRNQTFYSNPPLLFQYCPNPGPRIEPCLAQVQEPTTITTSPPPEEGPIELTQSIFATSDDPSPLQVATSVLLTGAISVFLFRSLRRRAKRSKELVEAKSPPSPVQALLGGLTAGVIALILYKFTTTVEAALNRQTISDNFSVRQITITIRTIINGLCYLATFVFGINSIGLLLYSGQLTINSFTEDSGGKDTENKGEQAIRLTEFNS